MEVLAVGVDIAEERKGLDVVALDEQRIVGYSRGGLSVLEARAAVLELSPSVVCIDSPSSWSVSGRSREAERELRRLGISSFATPEDPGDNPFYGWMKVGFRLFHELREVLPLYRGGDAVGTTAEVFPAATAFLLAGTLRPPNESKVQFRRRVLRDHNIDDSQLPNIDRVDAALAAVTGLNAVAGESSWIGDPAEGVILLPTAVPSVPLSAGAARRDETHPRPVRRIALEEQDCECGCGAKVRRRFLPGHDAKLKSRLRRQASDGDSTATARLRALGWA